MSASHVPDPAGLRLLVAVGRTGSIGGAARETGISQQAASERLRGIEAQTGLTLLRRGPRGSELTASGVAVTEWAARLIELTDEIETAILGLRGEHSRELSVWASMTIADGLMPRWLVQLRDRQVREGGSPAAVSLTAANSHQVEDAVRNGTAHVGFVEGVDRPLHVRSIVVAHDELVLVVAADDPLARRRTAMTAEEIAELPLTSREPGSGTREVVERALAEAGVAMHESVVELTTTTAVRGSVLAGGAPAFLSRRVIQRDVESGHLAVIRTTVDLRREFRAIWSGGPQPPAGPARDLVSIARGRAHHHTRTSAAT
ncbi:LysR family transcriptional regulator [Nocardioides lianchengensis]|uniref:ModE molybdate transport repressor domain-containing protein n=1 Tax=Nocardioides lianchengensis TaxID=1045774 RepID=A0A1G6UR25_9ACTN|nr:LysR family transcriptional regulator [Nocardioides lianchengensis]NYG11013.1 molybdate transport repressor ModE-like protein [Nocardioides lianchengensis]SDD43838.1 ModE molybdate transport repressor domain-containing protein [Nocardioides lianchengensis]